MPVRRVPLLSAQPPDSATLARQAVEAEVRQRQQLGEYTFEFHSTYRNYSKNGALRRQSVTTGETYISHRRNVDIVLARDGRPLKPTTSKNAAKPTPAPASPPPTPKSPSTSAPAPAFSATTSA